MKTTAAALTAALLATAEANSYVQWEIERRAVGGEEQINRRDAVFRRAAGAVEEPIKNSVNAYFASVAVGNPGQKFDLQLDTGSSDIWVPAASSSTCQLKNGCPGGSYNPKASSTYRNLGSNTFQISYADESGAVGDYIQEDFTIAGTLVKNMTMGLALKTKDVEYGLVGVGYMRNEASTQAPLRKIYPNLPVALQMQGKTNSIAYSLWLNDKTADKGNILFGAVDTEKFQGSLSIMDILVDERINNYTHFSVPLTSVSANSSSGNDILTTDETMPITAVLDSGTSLTYLPDDMAKQAWKEAGAIYDNSREFGIALIPCEFGENNKASFTFGFAGPNGPKIEVAMRDMVVPAYKGKARPFPSGPYKGKSICTFGIQNQTASDDLPVYLLGDTMLRSAYVVYDLVNNQIGIAPTKFNAAKSNIVTFDSNGATIPNGKTIAGGAKKEPTAPTNQFKAQSGFASGGGSSTSTIGSSGSNSGSGSSSDNSGNSNGKGDGKNAAVTTSALSGASLLVLLGSVVYAMTF